MLFGPPQPGVLPRNRHILVVAAKSDVGAAAIGEFQRLVIGDRDSGCASETRVRLFGERIFEAVYARASAKPEIAVERDPESPLEVITHVPFQGSDGLLRLRPRPRKEGVARKEILIRGEEPH